MKYQFLRFYEYLKRKFNIETPRRSGEHRIILKSLKAGHGNCRLRIDTVRRILEKSRYLPYDRCNPDTFQRDRKSVV